MIEEIHTIEISCQMCNKKIRFETSGSNMKSYGAEPDGLIRLFGFVRESFPKWIVWDNDHFCSDYCRGRCLIRRNEPFSKSLEVLKGMMDEATKYYTECKGEEDDK
jgi:hypothetical protein